MYSIFLCKSYAPVFFFIFNEVKYSHKWNYLCSVCLFALWIMNKFNFNDIYKINYNGIVILLLLFVIYVLLWNVFLQIDNETSSHTHFPLLFSGSELVVVGKLLHPNENNKNMNETMHAGELTGTSLNGTRTFPIHFNHYLPWFPPPLPRPTPPEVTPTEIPVSHDGNKPSKHYHLVFISIFSKL